MKTSDTIGNRRRELPPGLTELWTAADASEHFGRSRKTIGYLLRSREIKAVASQGPVKLYDLPAIEALALALSELESIATLAERLDRLEALEQEVAVNMRRYRNSPEMLAVLQPQRDSLDFERAVIESTDRRVNLQPIK